MKPSSEGKEQRRIKVKTTWFVWFLVLLTFLTNENVGAGDIEVECFTEENKLMIITMMMIAVIMVELFRSFL